MDISREELFALIWEKPTVEVARDMGISDVAVAKLCARLQVPKPPRGYWARVETGQATPRPPLRAFRDEIEERRKVLSRPRPLPGAVGLLPIQRKFVYQALLEFVAKGGDLGVTKVVSNQIRDLPPEIATKLLLLIQNRYLVWVKNGDVDVSLSHGARQSLAGLVDKMLPVAKPQVLVLPRTDRSFDEDRKEPSIRFCRKVSSWLKDGLRWAHLCCEISKLLECRDAFLGKLTLADHMPVSIPASVDAAEWNALKPSIGRVIGLMKR